MTGASGAPGRKPGLQGLTGRKPRPVVRGVPGHRGAADDQGPVLLPDRGSRWPVAGSLILGLILGLCPGGGRGAPLAGSWTKDARSRRHGPGSGAQGGPSGKVKGWRPGRIMDEGRPEPPPRPRIGTQGGPSGKVKGAALCSVQCHCSVSARIGALCHFGPTFNPKPRLSPCDQWRRAT